MEACAFLGAPEAGGGDLRRVRTAICLPRTSAVNAAACTSLQEHEDAKPAIGGLGMRGSEGAQRAADRWQRGGRRGRAAVRSKRLREDHTPAHLRRRQQRAREREKGIRATCRPPSSDRGGKGGGVNGGSGGGDGGYDGGGGSGGGRGDVGAVPSNLSTGMRQSVRVQGAHEGSSDAKAMRRANVRGSESAPFKES